MELGLLVFSQIDFTKMNTGRGTSFCKSIARPTPVTHYSRSILLGWIERRFNRRGSGPTKLDNSWFPTGSGTMLRRAFIQIREVQSWDQGGGHRYQLDAGSEDFGVNKVPPKRVSDFARKLFGSIVVTFTFTQFPATSRYQRNRSICQLIHIPTQ
jgi:hypothetical protein